MIPADLGAELATAVAALIADGALPPAAATCRAAGTWRPAPGRAGRAPGRAGRAPGRAGRAPGRAGAAPGRAGTAGSPDGGAAYATSLPFGLARLAGQPPAAIAARLAPILAAADGVSAAEPTGSGYLTITVTPAALTAIAVRTSQAGSSCARSDALRGQPCPAAPLPDLTAGLTWHDAWRAQAAALTGRLALAAGATPLPGEKSHSDFERQRSASAVRDAMPPGPVPGGQPARQADGPRGAPAGPVVTVAGAADWLGADAVRFWLARMPRERAGALGGDGLVTTQVPLIFPEFAEQPAMLAALAAVRLAHEDAAAALRQAAELGLARGAAPRAGELAAPAEAAVLERLSWLGERVAGAARRGEPWELPRYLELLAADWARCRVACPALPFGGAAAPRDAAGTSARLWLAGAVEAALSAGLALTGVSSRMPGSRDL